jgi:putative nucleotidyltransferase with HDIG domain
MQLSRNEALSLLQQHVQNEAMIRHCLASEAVMRALAVRLGQDEEAWGLAGLLHDLDVEITNADPYVHGQKTADLLSGYDIHPDIIDAIAMHNEMSAGKARSTIFQHALAAGETITGLIFATTFVYPDKILASVKPSSVVKRMKEKAFAASVKRENILECEKIGIPIADFAAMSIGALLPISEALGL